MAEMITLTFPDGAVKEFEKGITTDEIAGGISPDRKSTRLNSSH